MSKAKICDESKSASTTKNDPINKKADYVVADPVHYDPAQEHGQHPDNVARPIKEYIDINDTYDLSMTNACHLTYSDIIAFIRGTHALCGIVSDLQKDETFLFNPPTSKELFDQINLAIRRTHGKVSDEDIPSAEQRAANRESNSPISDEKYADTEKKAFPVDSGVRATSAHAYIHKYWNSPSKEGVTASYSKDNFIQTHKKIVSAMASFGIKHNYLDSLDAASGFKKAEEELKQLKQTQDFPSSKFYGGQKVVSFSRGRLKEIGTIKEINGLMASVKWGCGLETTELLARLIPIS